MKMYGIYMSEEVSEDLVKWFRTTFSSPSRASWYAEMEGLTKDEYRIVLEPEKTKKEAA